MGRFDDPHLRAIVYARDNYRCRWCGSQNSMAYDAHHIEYRRSELDDVEGNLITLCRVCHNYVHDSYKIPKKTAQQILFELIGTPGVTGRMIYRQSKAYEDPSDYKDRFVRGNTSKIASRLTGMSSQDRSSHE